MKATQKHAATSDATHAEIRRMALAGAAFFDVAMVQGTCLRNPVYDYQLFSETTTALGLDT